MRRALTSFAAVAIAALALVGCETRTVSYTFEKSGLSQFDMIRDEEKIRDTSGVENVITNVDSKGNATVQLYLDEENKTPGLKKMVDELGYRMVTP
jgi:hypothetical protein